MSAPTHATAPDRTNMLTASPSKTPARRVLGDKTAQVVNTPPKHQHASKASETAQAQSPLKQCQTLSPQMTMKENALPGHGPYKAGRKRSIYEVEGAENVDNVNVFGRRDGMMGPGMPVTTDALRAHLESADVHVLMNNNNDHGAEDDEPTPTEPDTPIPEEDQIGELGMPVSQETAGSKESFSWALNYSQTGETKESETENKPMTRAEKLRAKLQYALYKVNTHQTETPLAELQLPTPQSTPLLNTSTSTDATNNAPSHSSNPAIPSITVSAARRESGTHVVANLDPSSNFPKLGPTPMLPAPSESTVFTSVKIHDFAVQSSSPIARSASASPMRRQARFNDFRTPTAKRMRRSLEEVDDEQDDREETIEERLQRVRERRFEEGDLTSSVVKGHAAKGLLELMSGRR